MADRITRIVLLPRFTALYGTTPILGAPVNVKRFGAATLIGWRSQGLGMPPNDATVEYKLQQSSDLGIWHDVVSFTPNAEEETPEDATFDLEWVRLVCTVSGPNPGVTGWVVGHFVSREALVSFAR